MLVRVVDGKMFGHAIVQVLALDGVLMLVHPVDHVPPGLAFVRRHDVVSVADLAGDMILGTGAGVKAVNDSIGLATCQSKIYEK